MNLSSLAHALNSLSGPVLSALWRATWQGAAALGSVWLLTRIWKRMPSGVRSTLWLLVSLRMLFALTPAAIQLPILPRPVSASEVVAASPPITLPINGAALSSQIPGERNLGAIGSLVPKVQVSHPSKSPSVSLSLEAAGLLCWLLAAVATGTASVIQMLRALILLRGSKPIADSRLLTLAEEIRGQIGLQKLPRLLRLDEDGTDFTVGVVHPSVVLSATTLDACSDDELRIVLAHEFAHVHRRDSLFGIVPMLSQVLLCFSPIAWIAGREYLLARESACDEIALRSLNVGSELYGRLLLKLSGAASMRAPLCTPGVSSTFKLLRRRISMLEQPTVPSTLRSRRNTRFAAAIACLICAAPLYVVAASSSAPGTSIEVRHRIFQGEASADPLAGKVGLHPLDAFKEDNSQLKRDRVQSTSPVPFRSKAIKPVVTKKPTGSEPSPNLLASRAKADAFNTLSALFPPHSVQAQSTPAKKPSLQITLFALRFAKSEHVAKLLNEVLALGKERAGRASSDDFTNTVVVSCDEALLPQIRKVMTQLDIMGQEPDALDNKRKPSDTDSIRIYQLRNASAEDIAAVLAAAFRQQVTISTDKRTNAVIVSASDGTQRKVSDVFTRLDIPANLQESEMVQKHNKLYRVPASLFKTFLNNATSITHGTIDTVSYGGDDNFLIVRGTEEELKRVSAMEDKLRSGH